MRTSSVYIPLDVNYGLLELTYNSTVINTTDVSFLKIYNALNGVISYASYNPENYRKAQQLTGNTLDVTAQEISDTQWLHFDLDRPLRYFESQNTSLLFDSIWHNMDANINVTYNSLKVHILAGYNFTDIAGFIARIGYIDDSNNLVFVANNAYLKEDSINYNTRPIRIGDRQYDRYVEIKFPTLPSLLEVYGSAYPTPPAVGTGFKGNPSISTAKINIMYYEIDNYETDSKGQLLLNTVLPVGTESNGIFRRELDLIDPFSSITAIVQEAANGDFFELFPSYEGQFIEDYLAQRSSAANEEYMIIHDIDVYEALSGLGGYTEILTQSFTQIQETNFNEPFTYRPIIKNDNAVAFTIEYTVRLFDKNNPSHIIRRASVTSTNPKKYGRYLEKLDIPVGFQPLKVVNKILNENKQPLLEINPYYLSSANTISNSGTGTGNGQVQIIKNYTPVYVTDICVNTETLYVDSVSNQILDVTSTMDNLNKITNSTTVFGQGDGLMFLNEFDNFIKFKIYRLYNKVLEVMTDLTDSSETRINLAFDDSNGNKIKIRPLTADTNTLNFEIKPGEFIFKINSSDIYTIFQSGNNRFWITVENVIQDIVTTNTFNERKNFETVLYTGYWDKIENYNSISSVDYSMKNKLLQSRLDNIATKESTILTLQQKLIELKSSIVGTSVTADQQLTLDDIQNSIDYIFKNASS